MRIIANFDADGKLEKLHLDAVEMCNADSAENTKQLTIQEAMWLVRSINIDDAEDSDEWAGLFCQHCFQEGADE